MRYMSTSFDNYRDDYGHSASGNLQEKFKLNDAVVSKNACPQLLLECDRVVMDHKCQKEVDNDRSGELGTIDDLMEQDVQLFDARCA